MDSSKQRSEPMESGRDDKLHAEISRNGVSETVEPSITGAKISDLIVDLKKLKEHTNEILTKFVLEDTDKSGVRKAGNSKTRKYAAAEDEEESDEPEETDSTETKRHKA